MFLSGWWFHWRRLQLLVQLDDRALRLGKELLSIRVLVQEHHALRCHKLLRLLKWLVFIYEHGRGVRVEGVLEVFLSALSHHVGELFPSVPHIEGVSIA